MDIYRAAVDYLEAHHEPVEVEPEVLEEDVFHEEGVSALLSPLPAEILDLPDTPTLRTPEEMLEKRFLVLRAILESEEVYLRELEALLVPMKALRASAGTSQPVLSSRQVQTVFYQVPELREMHSGFYSGLKARMSAQAELNAQPNGTETPTPHRGYQLIVGDLFQKMMNQIGSYGGFIENYEKAVEVVRKCTQSDARFRTLAESMMSTAGTDKTRTKYTFEALLYKPLDRVTRTTLVLQDLLKTTPEDHSDCGILQEALRLSRSFLSGINESSQCKRGVTLSHGLRRQLMRDGFVLDGSEGEHNLRHLFLYTDLLLCTRFKPATKGKQDQYRFCWFLPLAGLRLRWVSEEERSPDTHLRLHTLRSKMYVLQQQIREQQLTSRGAATWATRGRKKLEQLELMLLTHFPQHRLELHSPNGRSQSLLFSSLYELEEWRDAIHKLSTDYIEAVPPDLLTLTGACVKLRMTQRPPLHSTHTVTDKDTLCGTLSVAVHSVHGLQEPACAYVCAEVDGFEFGHRQAQTHTSVLSLNPCWHQELTFKVDEARNLRLLCVGQPKGQEAAVLGKTVIKLDSAALTSRWKRKTVDLGPVEVAVSLKYSWHPLDPPDPADRQPPVFRIPIAAVAQQEGVLVPHVVRCSAEEVEHRGLEEVGIYRVSGTTSDISALKTLFDSDLREAVAQLRRAEVNAVSGVLKLFFRDLPEPLVPTHLFQSLAKMLDIQDLNSRLASMLSLLHSCPEPNRHTFLYLLRHLQRVSERQEVNKMTLMNLATVFGPSLLRPPVVGEGQDMDISQQVVVQVQVVFCYLQCNNLPEAQISLPHDAEDETTHM